MTNPINAPEVPIPSHALPLHSIAAHPLPSGVRGALVQRVSALPDGPLDVTWLATESPKLPLGRIRLRWEPASPHRLERHRPPGPGHRRGTPRLLACRAGRLAASGPPHHP